MEIAYWRPIEEVIGSPAGGRVRVKDVISARGELLSKENTDRMKLLVGAAVAGAAVACLTGMVAFGLREPNSEEVEDVAAILQERFHATALKPILEVDI